jgi:DNA-directed RNA polymerase specialized sigma24 family protein
VTGLAAGTGGYEAEPSEVRALADAELAPVFEGWPGDYRAQYSAITSRLVTMQAAVDLIAAERARVVAAMHEQDGMSYAQIADALGMSRARAQQLCQAGRDAAVRA